MNLFDAGVLDGYEGYMRARARAGTLGVFDMDGYLAAAVSRSPYMSGTLHGIALAAQQSNRQLSDLVAMSDSHSRKV